MEIKKLNPEEFGLSQESVTTIEQAFIPKIIERDALIYFYEQVINQEITPELCKQAKEVRLKLVKVRTGIADVHKSQKNFFLQAGKFVDSWKNKETIPVEQMEEKLKEIETYYERIEEKRIKDLEFERTELLRPYVDFIPAGLGIFEQNTFEKYLAGEKIAHAAKIQEAERLEKIRIEEENVKKEETERLRKEIEQLKVDLSNSKSIPVLKIGASDNEIILLSLSNLTLNFPIDTKITKEILSKFNGFKNWATNLIIAENESI